MNIYNQLEQLVIDTVGQIFDSLVNDPETELCGCEQCHLDVACYVLNRLPPKYVISERGFTHLESDQTIQETADLISLVKEGIDRVSSVRRPHQAQVIESFQEDHDGQWRNFPIVTGLLLNGHTFEPVSDASVELRITGTLARMKNGRWLNPLILPEQAHGRFSFWPAPVPVDADAAPSILDFDIRIQADGYESLHHYFQLTIETSNRDSSTPKNTHEVDNLLMFTV